MKGCRFGAQAASPPRTNGQHRNAVPLGDQVQAKGLDEGGLARARRAGDAHPKRGQAVAGERVLAPRLIPLGGKPLVRRVQAVGLGDGGLQLAVRLRSRSFDFQQHRSLRVAPRGEHAVQHYFCLVAMVAAR